MATQKEVLERLVNRDEIVHWAERNGYALEDSDSGGLYVGEWHISLDENNYIKTVERRLDEPREL